MDFFKSLMPDFLKLWNTIHECNGFSLLYRLWSYSGDWPYRMDYDEVLRQLGELGTYQKRILALCLLPIVFDSFGGPVSNFLMGIHLHR